MELNIYQKMNAISEEITTLAKTGHNSFHNYDYITEPNVLEALKPLLIKHGVFVTKTIVDCQHVTITTGKSPSVLTSVSVKYSFVNIDKPEDKIDVVFCGQGCDAQDKGIYKAMTGCNKYAFLKTFDIATGDDPEKDNGKNERKVSDDF
jgi:hypothetical protein